jgi:hypothetical protein
MSDSHGRWLDKASGFFSGSQHHLVGTPSKRMPHHSIRKQELDLQKAAKEEGVAEESTAPKNVWAGKRQAVAPSFSSFPSVLLIRRLGSKMFGM